MPFPTRLVVALFRYGTMATAVRAHSPSHRASRTPPEFTRLRSSLACPTQICGRALLAAGLACAALQPQSGAA